MFDGMVIHNNAPYAPQVEKKYLVEFKTAPTSKCWEHEFHQFEITVYTETRGITKLNTIQSHLRDVAEDPH